MGGGGNGVTHLCLKLSSAMAVHLPELRTLYLAARYAFVYRNVATAPPHLNTTVIRTCPLSDHRRSSPNAAFV